MASNASGIRAGQAYVEMYADQSKLERGLKQAVGHLKEFGGKVRGIFASAFGPVGTVVNSLVSTVEGPLGDAFGFISGQARGLFDAAVIQNFGDGIGAVGGELKAIWDLVYQQLGRVINGIIQNLAPGFQKGADRVKGLLAATRDWLMKNEQVIASFIKIATSGDVLWATMKLAWVQGTTTLKTVWNDFLVKTVSGALEVANKLASIFGGEGNLSDGGFIKALAGDNAKNVAALRQARQEYLDAVERAKGRNIDLNIAGAQGEEIQAAVGRAGARSAISGTFAAGAVSGLGGSRTEGLLRSMNEYQRKLVQLAEEQGKTIRRGRFGLPVG